MLDRYIVMWDMNGLEAIINVSDGEREAIVQTLADQPITWRNPIQFMLLRARFNSHRHYEIYTFDSEMTTKEISTLFKKSPQLMANTIREVGHQLYSDRIAQSPAIT